MIESQKKQILFKVDPQKTVWDGEPGLFELQMQGIDQFDSRELASPHPHQVVNRFFEENISMKIGYWAELHKQTPG